MELLERRLAFTNGTRYYCALALLLLCYTSSGQGQCGFNADIETGTFTGWSGSYGVCVDVNCDTSTMTAGLMAGRHTITSGNATDWRTCGTVPVTCPWGGQYSIKLGNDNIYWETEDLQYTYTVSATNPILVYAYAAVLQDPNHPDSVQPAFKTFVKDQNGNTVPCSYYKVNATQLRAGQLCNFSPPVWYKNWSKVAIDLSAYAGQTVTLYFKTNDCGWGGHFGYAYIDVIGCYPKRIQLPPCGTRVPYMVTAPDGFASYTWSTGQTGQSITVNRLLSSLSVTVTSYQGCQFTLTATQNITRPSLSMISHN